MTEYIWNSKKKRGRPRKDGSVSPAATAGNLPRVEAHPESFAPPSDNPFFDPADPLGSLPQAPEPARERQTLIGEMEPPASVREAAEAYLQPKRKIAKLREEMNARRETSLARWSGTPSRKS